MDHRPSAGLRIAGWSSVFLGLLITLAGGYLLLHFIRVGPDIAIAYVWSGGLVVIGVGMAAAGILIIRQRPSG